MAMARFFIHSAYKYSSENIQVNFIPLRRLINFRFFILPSGTFETPPHDPIAHLLDMRV